MKILISGSSGLIGSALLPYFSSKGHHVSGLSREASPSEGFDAMIHLAGESIASGRWTEAKKRAIRDSRTGGTRKLAEAIAQMHTPPKVLISASAIGYYGDRGEEILKENSAPGNGFLPDVCKAWEAATAPAVQKGVRVVNLRFGIILSSKGGALGQMLFPFKMGVGGHLGSGTQYMSWIALDDVLGVMGHVLETPSLSGPINTVTPKAVTNAEFTKILGRVLGRPTFLPMPAFAARLVFGEMADALLLASARVEPAALLQSKYPFQFPILEGALRHLLQK